MEWFATFTATNKYHLNSVLFIGLQWITPASGEGKVKKGVHPTYRGHGPYLMLGVKPINRAVQR